MSQIEKQKEFMHHFNMVAPSIPTLDPAAGILWARLIDEEFEEMTNAWQNFLDNPEHEGTQAELTAELVDVLYTVMGFAHSQGLPLAQMFNEVHAANIRKLQADGSVLRNEHGKVLKPEGWTPANKVGVIRTARETEVYGG
jgi:predicted HAD superfamily Cof-like phosphohydrolase